MGSTILIVESDPETRDRISGALRGAHDVIVASTTNEAVLRLGEGGIDGGVDGLLLLLRLGNGLLLLGAGLPPLLAPQRPPEVRVLAPVVVEVDYVSCLNSCAPCVSC